jgi:hypothetical protein
MSGNVYPLRSTQAAELVDADEKRWQTCRARCALLGRELRRVVADDGRAVYSIGLHRFESIEQAEDFLDQIVSDE